MSYIKQESPSPMNVDGDPNYQQLIPAFQDSQEPVEVIPGIRLHVRTYADGSKLVARSTLVLSIPQLLHIISNISG
eukprot:SAG31_NODE_14423_length_807_cov_1.317797_1_plen_76_part_00